MFDLESRLTSERSLIQVIMGPRQVGKTTGIKQLLSRWQTAHHYANADDIWAANRSWLLEQWQKTQTLEAGALLVIDEIQKIPNWPETIKSLWDQKPHHLRVVLLGSSSLQIQQGLSESLAGRYELIKVFHWTYPELKKVFAYTLDHYLVFGGYPASAQFDHDFDRWHAYVKESIVESVIGKDILSNRKVGNPSLFRQAFEILCSYPAQEISYTKLLGQLQDKGNTDLIKYYIELYSGAFLIYSLMKYSEKTHLSKGAIPKIVLSCPALYTLTKGPKAIQDPEIKGRLFELAVGATLIQLPGQLYYWRQGNYEVDYVYSYLNKRYAIEVKSGRKKYYKGLDIFQKQFPGSVSIIITPEVFESFSEDPHAFLSGLG